jgi:hypothetical protein
VRAGQLPAGTAIHRRIFFEVPHHHWRQAQAYAVYELLTDLSPACILAGCDQVILDEYCEQYMQREGEEPGSAPEISAFCALDDDEEPSI